MGKTILIVNDEGTIRAALKRMLPEKNYRVLEAADGRECLALASKHRPDLIVLDIVMPGLDGYTTLVRLQDDKRTASIPVIIFTGQSAEIHRQIALELGAVDFFSLGEGMEKIAEKAEAILRR